ncbi:MAG: NAD-dependent epimerase/dehydratase family protein [Bacteroidales bacterium]|nr:NAD-dependent epimerase/dehydratase family protein [Bacteroidales bacterium]
MKSVFITGANGLLGTNLTHLLLKQGYFVLGLVRDKCRFLGDANPNLQLIEGDLFDDFTKVLTNVDYVVHIAALTSQNLLNYADYWKVNSNATIQLFHAAAQCNVKRFVFVSTANTLGHGSFENPGNENEKAHEPFTASFYAQSKKVAEEHLLSHKHIMETIIVHPTFMLGAFDTKPGSGRIILAGWKRKIVFYPSGGKNFVHVADVADGIIKCIQIGRSGERYLLANENLSYKDFFKKLNNVANQKPVMIKIPCFVLLIMGCFGELLRGLGIATNLSLVNMKILCTANCYMNAKSKSELGMHYRPIELAISDALNYFKKDYKKV